MSLVRIRQYIDNILMVYVIQFSTFIISIITMSLILSGIVFLYKFNTIIDMRKHNILFYKDNVCIDLIATDFREVYFPKGHYGTIEIKKKPNNHYEVIITSSE